MNCPICDRKLNIRYEHGQCSMSCENFFSKKISMLVEKNPFNYTHSMIHYSKVISYVKNVKHECTTFVMHDMIFVSSKEKTEILEFGWSARKLLSLPGEIIPESVNLDKINTLLLFS